MTALGKTLVMFNLFFSLITGGLIVMVFLTRTNWRVGMEMAQKETQASQAAFKSEQQQRQQLEADQKNTNKKFEDEIDNLKKQVVQSQTEAANQKAQAEAAKQDASVQLRVSEAGSKEINKLQQERNQMADQLKQLNDDRIKLAKDLADTTQRETFNKLRGDALEKSLSETKESLALLQKKHEELKFLAGDLIKPGANPNAGRIPSIDTTGRVTSASGTIAVVSLGSDNGLEVGHVLQAYRTEPNALYLGQITLTKVEPHRAVGYFKPASAGMTIAVNDTVDTKVLR
jgi:hypothetical protein